MGGMKTGRSCGEREGLTVWVGRGHRLLSRSLELRAAGQVDGRGVEERDAAAQSRDARTLRPLAPRVA